MSKEVDTRTGVKNMIKNLEEALKYIEETEVLQAKLRKAYTVPYPVPMKYNILVGIVLYVLYKNGLPYGGWMLLGWFGWQICINVIYFMIQLYKKMPEIAQWKDKVNMNIVELEKSCRAPKKYWYSNAIQYFIKYLKSGRAKTIEECIELYEEN